VSGPTTIREADLAQAFLTLGIDLADDTLSIFIDFGSGDRPGIRIRRIALDEHGTTMIHRSSRGDGYLMYEQFMYWDRQRAD